MSSVQPVRGATDESEALDAMPGNTPRVQCDSACHSVGLGLMLSLCTSIYAPEMFRETAVTRGALEVLLCMTGAVS